MRGQLWLQKLPRRTARCSLAVALCALGGARSESGTPVSRSAIESVGPSAPNVLNSWLPDLGANQGPAD